MENTENVEITENTAESMAFRNTAEVLMENIPMKSTPIANIPMASIPRKRISIKGILTARAFRKKEMLWKQILLCRDPRI